MPIFPPVGHIGEGSTGGGREDVGEGRAGERSLWLFDTEVELTLSVLFSESTLLSVELELSHTNSDDIDLYEVRDCMQGGHL